MNVFSKYNEKVIIFHDLFLFFIAYLRFFDLTCFVIEVVSVLFLPVSARSAYFIF